MATVVNFLGCSSQVCKQKGIPFWFAEDTPFDTVPRAVFYALGTQGLVFTDEIPKDEYEAARATYIFVYGAWTDKAVTTIDPIMLALATEKEKGTDAYLRLVHCRKHYPKRIKFVQLDLPDQLPLSGLPHMETLYKPFFSTLELPPHVLDVKLADAIEATGVVRLLPFVGQWTERDDLPKLLNSDDAKGLSDSAASFRIPFSTEDMVVMENIDEWTGIDLNQYLANLEAVAKYNDESLKVLREAFPREPEGKEDFAGRYEIGDMGAFIPDGDKEAKSDRIKMVLCARLKDDALPIDLSMSDLIRQGLDLLVEKGALSEEARDDYEIGNGMYLVPSRTNKPDNRIDIELLTSHTSKLTKGNQINGKAGLHIRADLNRAKMMIFGFGALDGFDAPDFKNAWEFWTEEMIARFEQDGKLKTRGSSWLSTPRNHIQLLLAYWVKKAKPLAFIRQAILNKDDGISDLEDIKTNTISINEVDYQVYPYYSVDYRNIMPGVKQTANKLNAALGLMLAEQLTRVSLRKDLATVREAAVANSTSETPLTSDVDKVIGDYFGGRFGRQTYFHGVLAPDFGVTIPLKMTQQEFEDSKKVKFLTFFGLGGQQFRYWHQGKEPDYTTFSAGGAEDVARLLRPGIEAALDEKVRPDYEFAMGRTLVKGTRENPEQYGLRWRSQRLIDLSLLEHFEYPKYNEAHITASLSRTKLSVFLVPQYAARVGWQLDEDDIPLALAYWTPERLAKMDKTGRMTDSSREQPLDHTALLLAYIYLKGLTDIAFVCVHLPNWRYPEMQWNTHGYVNEITEWLERKKKNEVKISDSTFAVYDWFWTPDMRPAKHYKFEGGHFPDPEERTGKYQEIVPEARFPDALLQKIRDINSQTVQTLANHLSGKTKAEGHKAAFDAITSGSDLADPNVLKLINSFGGRFASNIGSGYELPANMTEEEQKEIAKIKLLTIFDLEAPWQAPMQPLVGLIETRIQPPALRQEYEYMDGTFTHSQEARGRPFGNALPPVVDLRFKHAFQYSFESEIGSMVWADLGRTKLAIFQFNQWPRDSRWDFNPDELVLANTFWTEERTRAFIEHGELKVWASDAKDKAPVLGKEEGLPQNHAYLMLAFLLKTGLVPVAFLCNILPFETGIDRKKEFMPTEFAAAVKAATERKEPRTLKIDDRLYPIYDFIWTPNMIDPDSQDQPSEEMKAAVFPHNRAVAKILAQHLTGETAKTQLDEARRAVMKVSDMRDIDEPKLDQITMGFLGRLKYKRGKPCFGACYSCGMMLQQHQEDPTKVAQAAVYGTNTFFFGCKYCGHDFGGRFKRRTADIFIPTELTDEQRRQVARMKMVLFVHVGDGDYFENELAFARAYNKGMEKLVELKKLDPETAKDFEATRGGPLIQTYFDRVVVRARLSEEEEIDGRQGTRVIADLARTKFAVFIVPLNGFDRESSNKAWKFWTDERMAQFERDGMIDVKSLDHKSIPKEDGHLLLAYWAKKDRPMMIIWEYSVNPNIKLELLPKEHQEIQINGVNYPVYVWLKSYRDKEYNTKGLHELIEKRQAEIELLMAQHATGITLKGQLARAREVAVANSANETPLTGNVDDIIAGYFGRKVQLFKTTDEE